MFSYLRLILFPSSFLIPILNLSFASLILPVSSHYSLPHLFSLILSPHYATKFSQKVEQNGLGLEILSSYKVK